MPEVMDRALPLTEAWAVRGPCWTTTAGLRSRRSSRRLLFRSSGARENQPRNWNPVPNNARMALSNSLHLSSPRRPRAPSDKDG